MSLIDKLAAVGSFVNDCVIDSHNAQIESKMDEIDAAIKVLQEQRNELAKELL